MWHCKCECGNERIVTGIHLTSGHTTSCGCKKAEVSGSRFRTHGMKHTRLYRIWEGMKSRCTIKTVPSFKHYGGRGIKICDDWLNSFESFHDWAISNGYTDDLSIDRIDVNGNYEPSNCRWVSMKKQSYNKRTSVLITHNGETHGLKEWSDIIGVDYYTMYSRYKAGKTPEQILSKEVKGHAG